MGEDQSVITNDSMVGESLYQLIHCPSNDSWRLLGSPCTLQDIALN